MGEAFLQHQRDSTNCILLQEKGKTSIFYSECFVETVYPLPIKLAKAQDVSQLVSRYVPAHLQGFYANLPFVTGDTDDEIDET